MKKRTKVLITLASIAVVGFSAYSGVWFYYKHNIWQPHIDNATVKLTAEWDDQCRITEYRYRDEETGDSYLLQMPSFGAFDCCVSASAPPSVSDLGSIVITWLNSVLHMHNLPTVVLILVPIALLLLNLLLLQALINRIEKQKLSKILKGGAL